jgi:hypothetical protein
MNASEILELRLHNSGLSHSPFKSAADAVSHLGAVQAQDFAAAKWALGLRIKNSTDEDIEKAFRRYNLAHSCDASYLAFCRARGYPLDA